MNASNAGHGPVDIAISCTGLSRSFGGVQALREVDLRVAAGTVHALVGENGAGKSTCLGVIAGRLRADRGEVRIFGEELRQGDSRASRRAGIATVYQELTIVPRLSPQANVFLARPDTRGGLLAERQMRRRYVELCERLEITAAPDVPAGTLSVAEQQLVEIARAVLSDARVILLDEPTAALSISERRALMRLIASLRAAGVTLVLVTHNLTEVLESSDEVSVFRNGRRVVTRPTPAFNHHDLVSAMLGDEAAAEIGDAADGARSAPKLARRAAAGGEPLLRAEGVSLPGRLRGVDVEVHAGEILGIGGLVGSGRTSLLRALAGAEPGVAGRLWIDGREVRWPRTPREARRLGIALIPEDRKSQGLALGRPIADNVAVSAYGAVSRAGFLSPGQLARAVRPALEEANVDVSRALAPVGTLSGGNQQKVLFARWMHERPRVLLADEPTRGVDVGAKTDILRQLSAEAQRRGLGVVLVSSELEEVIAFSGRIVVLTEGHARAMLSSTELPASVEDILRIAFAGRTEHVA